MLLAMECLKDMIVDRVTISLVMCSTQKQFWELRAWVTGWVEQHHIHTITNLHMLTASPPAGLCLQLHLGPHSHKLTHPASLGQ